MWKLFYFFRFIEKVPKDGRSQFLPNLLIIDVFQKRFCPLSGNTYFNEYYLVAAPASTEQKHGVGKHCIQTKTSLPPAKTHNCIALFISPDD